MFRNDSVDCTKRKDCKGKNPERTTQKFNGKSFKQLTNKCGTCDMYKACQGAPKEF